MSSVRYPRFVRRILVRWGRNPGTSTEPSSWHNVREGAYLGTVPDDRRLAHRLDYPRA